VTVVHETYHAHQHELVKKYPAGELGPHHEDYPTVLMFLANRTGIGCLYEEVVGGLKCRAQPQEIDAESNGQATADTVFASMQPRRQ
jgi:hypothetical protein